ncbi:MAG: TetR/AcrR family transcriptional regulator [Leeuwenhoekiella sp.]
MAGRPKTFCEDELIDSATRVFWQKGYLGASTQNLMAAMGVGQGSFYRSFPGGKQELYQKSLVRFLRGLIAGFYDGLEKSTDPIAYLKSFFYSIVDRSSKTICDGCFLGNALVELSHVDTATQKIAVEQVKQLKEGFKVALLQGKEQGSLKTQKAPELLAVHLINLWNGINLTQRMNPSDKELRELLALNLSVLE